jgi:hypothetical protein
MVERVAEEASRARIAAMRHAIGAFVLLVACVANADGTPAALEKRYPKPYTTERFTGYTISGLTLWHVQGPSVPDRNGDSLVVGVDARGGLVEGQELYRRAVPGLPPADCARRAVEMLMAGHGRAIDPAVDKPIFSREEWTLVKAPEIAGGVLTFFTYQGEMAPSVVRIQVTQATGELARRPAGWILHPPEAAIPGIRAKLRAKDKEVVSAGLHEVSEWKELAPDVEALLGFPDASVRMQAIGVLGNLHQDRSVAALIRLLEQAPEWGDRSLAGQALVMRFGQSPGAIDAVRAHVARGGGGAEIGVLGDVLKDWDAGKRY